MEGPHAASLVQEGVTHTGRRSRTVGSAECHRGSAGISRSFLWIFETGTLFSPFSVSVSFV